LRLAKRQEEARTGIYCSYFLKFIFIATGWLAHQLPPFIYWALVSGNIDFEKQINSEDF
jgi:hypothetical protein